MRGEPRDCRERGLCGWIGCGALNEYFGNQVLLFLGCINERNQKRPLSPPQLKKKGKNCMWPRDRYTGPGGGLYTGPGGGLYTGPDGGMYTGPGGGLYTGPSGGMYTGPGGGLYTGPGGGLYTGPGGGLYTGPGGGLYTGPGGGLYTGPGGGLYTGPCDEPYQSNWPPPRYLIEYLMKHGMKSTADYMVQQGFLYLC